MKVCKLAGKCKYIQKAMKVGNRALLKADKHKPEILLGVGIVGAISGTVLACRATLKVNELLDETHEVITEMKTVNEVEADEVYNDEDLTKDLTILYVQTGLKVAKLYSPALIIGGLSIASLIGGNRVQYKRNVALAAAYTAMEKGFAEYRARVVEELGVDKDHQFRYNTEEVKYKEEEIDPETGKKKKVTKKAKVAGADGASIYARFFDEASTQWTKTPEYNLVYIKAQQHYLSDLLHTRGHVFLNEAYDALGLPRTQAGQIVGWVINDTGDNFVDFGLCDIHKDDVRDFVNGYERSVLLDFNVDGVIHNLI